MSDITTPPASDPSPVDNLKAAFDEYLATLTPSSPSGEEMTSVTEIADARKKISQQPPPPAAPALLADDGGPVTAEDVQRMVADAIAQLTPPPADKPGPTSTTAGAASTATAITAAEVRQMITDGIAAALPGQIITAERHRRQTTTTGQPARTSNYYDDLSWQRQAAADKKTLDEFYDDLDAYGGA